MSTSESKRKAAAVNPFISLMGIIVACVVVPLSFGNNKAASHLPMFVWLGVFGSLSIFCIAFANLRNVSRMKRISISVLPGLIPPLILFAVYHLFY